MKTNTLISRESPLGAPVELLKQSFHTSHASPVKRVSFITGLHGDELEGLYICHKLIHFLKDLQRHRPGSFQGEVHVYPAVNPLALNHISRLWPYHHVDMNRTMGNPQADSLPTHFSQALLNDIMESSDLAVDLHASNLHLRELPQVRVVDEFARQLLPLAEHTNTDVVWIHPMAGLFESTLGYNLNRNKIPTLVIEAGISLRITPETGDQVFTGMVRLLKHTGVLTQDVELPGPARSPLCIQPSQVVLATAQHPGLFLGQTQIGKQMNKGDLIGQILDPISGSVLEEIVAPETGLLFTLRELPLTYAGGLVGRLALEDEPEPC